MKKIRVVTKSHATLGLAILKVIELHQPLGPEYCHPGDCIECNEKWPCPTTNTIIEILEESDEVST